jgi:hypothetical protein
VTPDERADAIVSGPNWPREHYVWDADDALRAEIAAAIRQAVEAERERCAGVAERTARLCEQRVGVEPLRAKYSHTIAQSDRNAAVELRDVALLIREGE